MPYASTKDGTSVYYELYGDGPALVLLHGSGGHHAIWWQQITHFQKRFKVVALDFPGFGNSDSDPKRWGAVGYPDAILAVLDDAGIDTATLVGQSLGCAPSLALAISHPERISAVVLAHSVGGINDEALLAQVRADREQANKLTVLDRLLSKQFQEEQPEKVLLFRQMGSFNQAGTADAARSHDWQISAGAVSAVIRAGVFVCFLQGTEDAVVRPAAYEIVKQLLPSAHVEAVSGAPHSLYWENPELFNATLDRILKRASGPA